MRFTKTLIVCMSILLILTSISTMSAEGTEKELIIHNQTTYTITYGSDVEVSVTSNESNIDLFYKSNNETNWNNIAMVEGKDNVWTAKLPINALTPPGLEYYFVSENYKTDIYKIITEYDPISGSPFALNRTDQPHGATIGYDLQYFNGKLPNGKTVSVTAQTPTGSYPTVSSKLWELRSCCTNPHRGIDLSVYKVDVRATIKGKIKFVNDSTSGSAGRYIEIAHNADGSIPSNVNSADFYSHYYHLDSIKNNPSTNVKWKVGDTVNAGDIIGVSGDTGSPGQWHLDFGFDIYQDGNRVPLPAKYFFPNISSWNNGMDLDFIQPPRIWFDSTYGTMLEVFVYPKGTTDNQNPDVKLVFENSDQTINMLRDRNNPNRYYAYLVGYGFDNRYANLYIQVFRKDNRGNHMGVVTRPLQKFGRTDASGNIQNPISSAKPTHFYNVYIQRGLIQPDSIEIDYLNAPQSINAIELTIDPIKLD